MRRAKKISSKIVILVILSGLFNLFSYAFDQLVIQSELKNRELERKLISNRIELESLSYEITTLTDLSFDIFKSSNYFYKQLPSNLFGSLAFISNDKIHEIYSLETSKNIGNNFEIKLQELVVDFNNKVDEIDKIFTSMFPFATRAFPLLETKISENILDKFNNTISNNENEQSKRDEDNYKIYSEIYDKIEEFESFEFHFNYFLARSEREYVINFANFFNFVDTYAEVQNRINYYILLSIISQIFGILFILLLFKSILTEKKLNV